MTSLCDEVEARLMQSFDPHVLRIVDTSHEHVGHAASKLGKAYLHIIISSNMFMGLKIIDCHRMIYKSLSDWLPHRIHALTIEVVSSNDV